jgi:hypothetical protein
MKILRNRFSYLQNKKLSEIILISLILSNLFLGETWSRFTPINSLFLNINEYLLIFLIIIFLANDRNLIFGQKIKIILFTLFVIYCISKNQFENLYFLFYDLAPLVIFYFFYLLSYKKINIQNIKLFINSKSLAIISLFFLLDYFNDRKFAFKIFNNYEISINDLSQLTLMQSSAVIVLLFGLNISLDKKLGSVSIFLLGFFLGFAMLESRLTTWAFVLFLVSIVLYNKIKIKHFILILLAVNVCLLIPQNSINDLERGIDESKLFKITLNTPSCFYSNFIFLDRDQICQLASQSQVNILKIKNDVKSENVIVNEYCKSTFAWRLTLWKSMYEYQFQSLRDILLGTGVGFSTIEKVIPSDITRNCYADSINQGLRSGHSSIFNFGFRFGLLNLGLLLFTIIKYLLKSNDPIFNLVIMFFGFYSIFDPILDSPTIAIPFWILFFFLNRKGCINNE